MEDLTGKQFGKWKVLKKDTDKHKTLDVRWICECECGTVKSVLGKYLRNGISTSCGCSKKVDYTGRKYGKLTVLETLYNYKRIPYTYSFQEIDATINEIIQIP